MSVFDLYYEDYEKWFEKYSKIYEEEIKTIKAILPPFKKAIEVGVGTGRFAKPLGIDYGIEVSEKMAEIGRKRGIKVDLVSAENMNFEDEFDLILMVTTICFVKDPKKVLANCYKALKVGGSLVVAFVDKNSALGKFYEKNKKNSKFYKEATFFSKDEIIEMMKEAGFKNFECKENLYGDSLENLRFEINDCNQGAFKVIKGEK